MRFLAVLAIAGGIFLIYEGTSAIYEGKSAAGFVLFFVDVAAILALVLLWQFGINGGRQSDVAEADTAE